jgi:hypothetical protein
MKNDCFFLLLFFLTGFSVKMVGVLLDPDLRFGTKAKLTTSVVFAHERGDGVVCIRLVVIILL